MSLAGCHWGRRLEEVEEKEKEKEEEGGVIEKQLPLSRSFPLFKEEPRALLMCPSPAHALPEDHRHVAMVFATKTHFP